jgi:hypothetical protein
MHLPRASVPSTLALQIWDPFSFSAAGTGGQPAG